MPTLLSRGLPEWGLTGSHSEKQAKFYLSVTMVTISLARKKSGSYFLMALKVYDIDKTLCF